MNSLFKIFKKKQKAENLCGNFPEKNDLPGRKKKILLINERTELSELFNENNCEIIRAGDCKKALSILEKEPVDILLGEYQKGNDCRDIYAYIKNAYPSLTIIIFTDSQDFFIKSNKDFNQSVDKEIKTGEYVLDEKKKLEFIRHISEAITKPLDILTGKFLLTESDEMFMAAGEFKKIKHAFKYILMLCKKIKKISSDGISIKKELPALHRQYCSVRYIIDETVAGFHKNVFIKKEYILHTGKTYIDEPAIKLALYIILENFIIHNSESKKIRLRVVNSEDDLSISIMTDSSEPVPSGAFLYDERMSVAEEIIKAHRGEIRIRNREFITIFIPLPFKEIRAINKKISNERLLASMSFIFSFFYYFFTCLFIKKINRR